MAFSYFKKRDNAIKAWDLEGYTLLEHIDKAYGLTQEYLYHIGLLEKKEAQRICPPSTPYKLSKFGKLYLTEDEGFSLILVRPNGIHNLLLICISRSLLDK